MNPSPEEELREGSHHQAGRAAGRRVRGAGRDGRRRVRQHHPPPGRHHRSALLRQLAGLHRRHPGLRFGVYNRDDPNRPLPGQDDAQGEADDITLVRQPGSSGLCPSNGTGSAAAIGRGETTPGSGIFGRKLYLTS